MPGMFRARVLLYLFVFASVSWVDWKLGVISAAQLRQRENFLLLPEGENLCLRSSKARGTGLAP